jgi:hypothetical protein
MSLKTKIMNIITAHPKLVTLGIGFAVTATVSTIIGLIIPVLALTTVGMCITLWE